MLQHNRKLNQGQIYNHIEVYYKKYTVMHYYIMIYYNREVFTFVPSVHYNGEVYNCTTSILQVQVYYKREVHSHELSQRGILH